MASQLWGPLPSMTWSIWQDGTASSLYLARVSTGLRDGRPVLNLPSFGWWLRRLQVLCGHSGKQLNRGRAGLSPLWFSPQTHPHVGWAVHKGCISFHCLLLGKNYLEGAARLSRRPQWELCWGATGCHPAGRKGWSSSQHCAERSTRANPGVNRGWRGWAAQAHASQ